MCSSDLAWFSGIHVMFFGDLSELCGGIYGQLRDAAPHDDNASFSHARRQYGACLCSADRIAFECAPL